MVKYENIPKGNFVKTFVIAEAGVNHNGDLAIAKELIDVATASGADAIKFQTFIPEQVISRFAQKAEYQKDTTDANESQLDMVRRLTLDATAHRELISYCKMRDIMFLSTPFDFPSIDLLVNLGLSIFKIPSGEIINLPYLRKIGALHKQIIMSTGMATLDEVKTALSVLIDAGSLKDMITVLHCHTDYPTQMKDVNLRAMVTLREELDITVGYSDHTPGIEVPIAAVALGARVIEKHFTLDKKMKGPDHRASLEPTELSAMISAIRHIEEALGDGIKRPTQSEQAIMKVARKSIVAAKSIQVGEEFTENNITPKRPGTGISPMQWDLILGQKAKRNFEEDELIEI